MKKIFDTKYAKDMAKGFDLKVKLKKNFKGTSLYSKKEIKKGGVIAYYKFLVHKNDDSFNAINDNMYAITVYSKKGRARDSLIGDIYEGSLEPPKNNIPFWGYFSNEPSGKQEENAALDINLKSNYRNRDKVKPGDTIVYKLVATRNIKPNEEITWCYGSAYNRNYKANCEDD